MYLYENLIQQILTRDRQVYFAFNNVKMLRNIEKCCTVNSDNKCYPKLCPFESISNRF